MGVIGVPYLQKQAVDSAEYGEWEANHRLFQSSGIETFQSAECSGQHGMQSSQQTAACSHFFIREKINKVKTAGCLSWGSSGCRICRSRLSTHQNAAEWNGGRQILSMQWAAR